MNTDPECEHGQLARQCETCERNQDLAYLRNIVRRAHELMALCDGEPGQDNAYSTVLNLLSAYIFENHADVERILRGQMP